VKRSSKADSSRAAKVAPQPDDGDDEFSRAMAGVVPLRRERPDRVPHSPPAIARTRHKDPPKDPGGDGDSPGESSFTAPGVDRRELRRLTRGEYAIGRRLDLHGLTAGEAIASVTRFLDNSRHARHRAVCIVHGRGRHSESGIAVLRARVRECLRSHRAVLGFADAPPDDGGAGAVYVLLRK
jgi:DNA-nicking Smr family endonuclease